MSEQEVALSIPYYVATYHPDTREGGDGKGIVFITAAPGMIGVARKICEGCDVRDGRNVKGATCKGIDRSVTTTAHVDGEYGARQFGMKARCMVKYHKAR